MSIFSWYPRFHWRLFNVLGRVLGIMFVFFGALFVISGVYYALNPGAAEGIETAGWPVGLMNVTVGACLAAIGTAVLRAKPYRPDLGDAAWTFTMRRSGDKVVRSRSWWTGEPRAGSQSGTTSGPQP